MAPRDLLAKLHDKPFQPFRVRLSTSEVLDVTDPGTVIVGETSAIMPVATRKDDYGFELVQRWKTVSLAHIVTFENPETGKAGKRTGGRGK